MAYESDDYTKMKTEFYRAHEIKAYIDMAREFQRMKYCGVMTVSAMPPENPYLDKDGISLVALDALKAEIIRAATEWAVSRAKNLSQNEPVKFDIDKCLSV